MFNFGHKIFIFWKISLEKVTDMKKMFVTDFDIEETYWVAEGLRYAMNAKGAPVRIAASAHVPIDLYSLSLGTRDGYDMVSWGAKGCPKRKHKLDGYSPNGPPPYDLMLIDPVRFEHSWEYEDMPNPLEFFKHTLIFDYLRTGHNSHLIGDSGIVTVNPDSEILKHIRVQGGDYASSLNHLFEGRNAVLQVLQIDLDRNRLHVTCANNLRDLVDASMDMMFSKKYQH
jgi:hypothetical protein